MCHSHVTDRARRRRGLHPWRASAEGPPADFDHTGGTSGAPRWRHLQPGPTRDPEPRTRVDGTSSCDQPPPTRPPRQWLSRAALRRPCVCPAREGSSTASQATYPAPLTSALTQMPENETGDHETTRPRRESACPVSRSRTSPGHRGRDRRHLGAPTVTADSDGLAVDLICCPHVAAQAAAKPPSVLAQWGPARSRGHKDPATSPLWPCDGPRCYEPEPSNSLRSARGHCTRNSR